MQLVDMVLHEVTRHQTPTSARIMSWVETNAIACRATRTYSAYCDRLAAGDEPVRKAHLGEIAIQEAMNEMALTTPDATGLFLFEDHKIARASFLLPPKCRKISTRAWLLFLEDKGWIESAAEIERAALHAGRHFSRLRFPP
ncbi:hypothetical protein F2Q65_01390 [Thiohalocapsa marina]|uniref:Uncharacterized protein n=1 Tax=Thiohalocapsa marina TaxID=424902 RepID=A0A5M8FVQ3_9GAMM|nr:hypothetical protein [Thiohalocapsa marina]KAA6187911.1 hypothetical protein F2Q65_01390 [Thiohalocapsa marina]